MGKKSYLNNLVGCRGHHFLNKESNEGTAGHFLLKGTLSPYRTQRLGIVMMIMTNVLLLVQMLAFSKIPPFGKSNHHGDQLHLMYVRLRIIHTIHISPLCILLFKCLIIFMGRLIV